MKMERDAVKEVNPDIPVTANLMGFYDGLDYFKFGPELDVVSWDNYPQWHTTDNVEIAVSSAMTHDVMRSIKHENFLLMESTPSMTNWTPISMLKRPGMHLLSLHAGGCTRLKFRAVFPVQKEPAAPAKSSTVRSSTMSAMAACSTPLRTRTPVCLRMCSPSALS